MIINITRDQFKALEAAGIKHPNVACRSYHDNTEFDTNHVSATYLEKLYDYAMKNKGTMNGVLQVLSMVRKVAQDPTGAPVKLLNQLCESIIVAMSRTKTRWLWDVRTRRAYLFAGAKYHPRDKDDPAYVAVSLKYYSEGNVHNRTIRFSDSDLNVVVQRKVIAADVLEAAKKRHKKRVKQVDAVDISDEEADKALGDEVTVRDKTLVQLLFEEGFVMETNELIDEYTAVTADWEKKYMDHFTQYLYNSTQLALGDHSDDDDDDYIGRIEARAALEANSSVFRVVNDVPAARIKSVNLKHDSMACDDEGNTGTEVHDIPIHPLVYVFNLGTHTHMWIEAAKMTKYVYDRDLVNRLIIKPEYKNLIRILTQTPDVLRADFVAGKSGGTVILALGDPGVGKSMSAEAFAEASEKVLYRVQSDQLGIQPNDIEKRLKDVFARAERWGAVLLVDEADIYIRSRGFDIQHNAVVGTLLRTLEWFNGIIFMTSNMGTIIDDAIISRCSAVIRYDYPTVADATTIFNNFCELFQMSPAMSTAELTTFLEKHELSGRSIKNLLRLVNRLGRQSPTVADLESTMLFLSTESKVARQIRAEAAGKVH